MLLVYSRGENFHLDDYGIFFNGHLILGVILEPLVCRCRVMLMPEFEKLFFELGLEPSFIMCCFAHFKAFSGSPFVILQFNSQRVPSGVEELFFYLIA